MVTLEGAQQTKLQVYFQFQEARGSRSRVMFLAAHHGFPLTGVAGRSRATSPAVQLVLAVFDAILRLLRAARLGPRAHAMILGPATVQPCADHEL